MEQNWLLKDVINKIKYYYEEINKIESLPHKQQNEEDLYRLYQAKADLEDVCGKLKVLIIQKEDSDFSLDNIINWFGTDITDNMKIVMPSSKKVEIHKGFDKTNILEHFGTYEANNSRVVLFTKDKVYSLPRFIGLEDLLVKNQYKETRTYGTPLSNGEYPLDLDERIKFLTSNIAAFKISEMKKVNLIEKQKEDKTAKNDPSTFGQGE